MEITTGQQIKGYELQERIAAGGFGAVYRAWQSTVGREVAIKIILPGLANKPDFIRRFESEAQLIARLEHPFIVPLHDYWRDPDGAFLVMRYLRGGSLQDYLQKNGAFNIEDTLTLFSQIAQGLNVAHRSQVIHRDIKPGNILLDEDGNAYLADFGIAKDHTLEEGITAPESFIGSPEYLAPEQARSEAVTPQTDIYSLGVVLYEMLAGDHPFPGIDNKIGYIFKHLNDALPEIETLDDSIRGDINEVIQKATAKDPAHRFKDVLEMMASLRQASQLDATATPTSLIELLTPREQEVMQLIIDGKSNREIADVLVLAEGTIKQYISSIYRKLKVRSRVQAIARVRDLEFLIKKPEVIVTTGHLPEPENPYKGLQAFQSADAQQFFGRGKLTQKLLNRLQEETEYHRFLAIVGPSGSGKSSVVKAGLIPALWRGDLPGSENWYIADMLPGDHPLDELEVALTRLATDSKINLREQLERDKRGLLRVADMILPDDNSEILLVIDQFEEVFTLLDNDDDRLHFLHLLQEAVTAKRSRVRIIVTLRADYYDKPLQYPDFGELMRSRVETVLPLGAEELERVINEPAQQVGVQFEEGLVSRIVADVHYQPGALPLLQYALTELFERRDNRTLTQQAYQDIGGTGGALANRADELFHEGSEEHQAMIQQMFLRLVTLGEGAEDTRRRVDRAELLDIASDRDMMDEIIDVYADSRLLSLDNDPATRRPTVEVAHEAILREWERLRTWLNDSRDDIRQERNLARSANDWDKHNRDSSYLLHGNRLEQIEKWRDTSKIIQTAIEKHFITESLKQRNKENQAEIKRQQREAQLENRSRNFLRGLVAVLAIATMIAGGFGLFALNQRDIATDALAESVQSEAEFRSIALTFGAQDALNNGQPDVALALAQEANNMDTPPVASQNMFVNASSSSWIQQGFPLSDIGAYGVRYHPDGQRIITTHSGGWTTILDIETGEELQSIQRENVRVFQPVLNPQGNLVAIPAWDGILQIWNLETDEVTEHMYYDTPAFNSDGSLMLTSNFWDGVATIHIHEAETFTVLSSFEAHGDFISTLHFSEDDSLLISSSGNWDGTVKIWDAETNELLQERQFGFDSIVWQANFLSDNEYVLVGTGAGEVSLWNWLADEIIWTITVEGGSPVQDIAISPDNETFAIALGDPVADAQLREVATGKLIHLYQGHTLRIQDIEFSPDGKSLITASNDGTLNIWSVNWEGTTQTHSVNSNNLIVWHPTRPLIATVGVADNILIDMTIRLIDTTTGQVIEELVGHEDSVRGLAFSPDGNYLISGGIDRKTYVWDIDSGEQVRTVADDIYVLENLVINSEGQIATNFGDSDNEIILLDYETGERNGILTGHQDQIFNMEYSPDEQFLYTSSRITELYKWDLETGEIILEFTGHTNSIYDVDVNSNGTRLLSASADETAVIWDSVSGEALMTLSGHTDKIIVAEFSPDDNLIMTASLDERIILWDAETGDILQVFTTTHNPPWISATFSPDGTQIVSSTNDILTFWDITNLPDDYQTWVIENRYIPDFTCDQRALYIIEPLCEEDS